MQTTHHLEFGIVAIGRNEGERLRRCLQSLPPSVPIVYVDSGSTDGSDLWAQNFGADVVRLQSQFTAARARNAGFRRLLEIAPDIKYVQFVDGDCELVSGWLRSAVSFLHDHPNVAAVFGRRRERNPEQSVYNLLCDWEWDGPVGEARAFGGDVLLRVAPLAAAGGYREELIAGEEPELSVRLRAARWQIWRLGVEMTLHDIAITSFGQWWRRHVRSGYAFAEGAHLHGAWPERHWVWESRRAWLWGLWLPLLCVASPLLFGIGGFVIWLIYPVQIMRQLMRGDPPIKHRMIKAIFQLVGRFPEVIGQMKFARDRLSGRRASLIEYK